MPSIDDLRKLLDVEPTDVFLNYSLAMALRQDGQLEEAVAHFRKINEMDPSYVPAYFMQGQTLIALDRRDEARAVLESGIEAARKNNDHHAVGEMTETLQAMG